MKRGIRRLLTGVMTAAALTAAAFTAYGASTVSSLRITVKDSLEEGNMTEPEISVSPSSCQLMMDGSLSAATGAASARSAVRTSEVQSLMRMILPRFR